MKEDNIGTIVVGSIIIVCALLVALFIIDRWGDYEINKIENKANKFLDSSEEQINSVVENLKTAGQCEISYRGLVYKGLCTEDVIKYFNNYVAITLEIDAQHMYINNFDKLNKIQKMGLDVNFPPYYDGGIR